MSTRPAGGGRSRDDGQRRGRRGGGGGGRRGGRPFRRRSCYFCETKEPIDYKKVQLLRRFVADSGRIEPRRRAMTCARHQRRVAVAIKRARYLALLPYSVRRRPHAV
jgi:small subunit ribosomal protein S18